VSGLDDLFARCRSEGRAALIGYLPAGFPSYDLAVAALTAMVEEGVDAVEVGMPYSDPLMEGPVIQAAHQASLDAGTRQADVLRTVEAVAATGAPTLVMGYWNPVHRYGFARWARALKDAGGVGAITPDLIPDEAGPWIAASDAHDLERVFLVAPSSTDARLRSTSEACRGWVYAASTMGVTGTRATVSDRFLLATRCPPMAKSLRTEPTRPSGGSRVRITATSSIARSRSRVTRIWRSITETWFG